MAQHSDQPVDVDPHTLAHSRALWSHFTQAAKYGVIAVAITLLLMFFFVA